jgi:hypothetical protein
MRLLLDYDNVPSEIRSQGLLYFADRVFEALHSYMSGETHLDMKIYGGWYEGDKLTRKAQDMILQLANLPYPLWIKDPPPARLVRITGGLAHSLESLPRKFLHATYRQRPPARRLACDDPRDHSCSNDPCELSAIVDFIRNQKCPRAGCAITPKLLLRGTGEQKLVDTMLVADLIHLARDGAPVVAIVTSDDDVWPGIITALVSGTHVIHVRTGNDSGQSGYLDGVPGKYTELSL